MIKSSATAGRKKKLEKGPQSAFYFFKNMLFIITLLWQHSWYIFFSTAPQKMDMTHVVFR